MNAAFKTTRSSQCLRTAINAALCGRFKLCGDVMKFRSHLANSISKGAMGQFGQVVGTAFVLLMASTPTVSIAGAAELASR